MKTFIKRNALFLTALLIVIVAVFVVLITNKPSVSYIVSSEELLQELNDTTITVTPFILHQQLQNNKLGMVLVDIRNTDDYARSHIQGAANIPVLELLQKNPQNFFRKLLKDGQQVVLYGNDEVQAEGPAIFLRQLGFNNVKVLQGGYSVYQLFPVPDSLAAGLSQLVFSEKSIIDTSALRPQVQSIAVKKAAAENSRKEKVVPVKHAPSAGGGC